MPKKWKAVQSKNKAKAKTALALKTLFLIFVLLLIGFAVNIVKNLSQPLSYRGFDKGYIWEGDFKINLVVRNNNISVLSFDPAEQTIRIIDIPDETYIEVTGGFGSWQVRSIYDLGQSERRDGATALALSLSNFLGAPIDGFIEPLNEFRQMSAYDLVSHLRSNPLNYLQFLGNSKISLTPTEFTRLAFNVYLIRFDKITRVDLKKEALLKEKVLPDGNPGLIGDPLKIDGFASNNFIDQKLRKDEKTVAVFNASKKPGIAQKVANLISHLGGNVIFTTNASSEIRTSLVLSNDGTISPTLIRLSQIFAPHCLKVKCAILNDPDIANSRADINVVLGTDY
ncbi:LCP family protein [Candidatus Daviesbacteria bacterium]|nr:LCP family protein [Candidatus Daviesbacteria bacterium]